MPVRFDALLGEAKALLPDCVALRRRLHAHPELGLVLPETQRAVLEALGDLDLEIETGGATSAVVATLRGARPGPTILLRADMDALPMKEETGLPFASHGEGAHACLRPRRPRRDARGRRAAAGLAAAPLSPAP